MRLREAYFRWLLPAAVILPAWLIVGGLIFHAGWGMLWVLFIAAPSVLVGQALLAVLTRSRASVRAARAVSWWDVAGFSLWHVLTIAVGCFIDSAFGWLLAAAVVVGLGLIWLQVWQLWSELRSTGAGIRDTISWATIPDPAEQPAPARDHEVIVVHESDPHA